MDWFVISQYVVDIAVPGGTSAAVIVAVPKEKYAWSGPFRSHHFAERAAMELSKSPRVLSVKLFSRELLKNYTEGGTQYDSAFRSTVHEILKLADEVREDAKT